MNCRDLQPGDVVIHRFNSQKHRPWLVLWVDDDEGMCLVAAITKTGISGMSIVKLGVPESFRYGTLGVWVMKWPVGAISPSYVTRYPEITPEIVAQARAAIAKEMDL